VIAPVVIALALVIEAAEPYVYEVAPGKPSLERQRTAVPGATPSRRQPRRPLFFAAPFTVRGGRIAMGEWRSSDEILGPRKTRVVVVASWCPACHHFLGRLTAERPQRTVIMFLADEAYRRGAAGGAPLVNAASLERYPLELHVLDSDSPLAQVSRFPTTFTCSREACTPDAPR
jgi:hypothetical protein